MAIPIAVPREVVSLSTASIRRSVSVVGGTTSRRTRRRRRSRSRAVVLRLRMNVRAASWATTRRFGWDIGRAHRAGDVDRQQDRRRGPRRPSMERSDARGEPEADVSRREQRHRDPSPPVAATGRDRGANHGQVRDPTASRRRRPLTQPQRPASRTGPTTSVGSAHGQLNDIRRPARTSASSDPPPASEDDGPEGEERVISVFFGWVTRRSIASVDRVESRRRVGGAYVPPVTAICSRSPGSSRAVATCIRRRWIAAPSALPTPIADMCTPSSAASRRRRTVPGPPVSSPSDTNRIEADRKKPRPGGAGSSRSGSARLADDRAHRDVKPRTQRRSAARLQPVDRGQHLAMRRRRLLGDQRPVAEGDHPDLDRRGWAATKRRATPARRRCASARRRPRPCCWTRRRRPSPCPRRGAVERRLRAEPARRSTWPAPRQQGRTGHGAARPGGAPAVSQAGPMRRRAACSARRRWKQDVADDEHGHRKQRGQHAGPDEPHRRACVELRTISIRAAARSS